MVKLFLSLGRRDNISAGDIVGMLHNECHLERGTVGQIRLMPGFSFVEVREESAPQAIEAAGRAKLRGKSFKLDIDRGPGQGGGSGGGESRPSGGSRDDRRGGGNRRDRPDRGRSDRGRRDRS